MAPTAVKLRAEPLEQPGAMPNATSPTDARDPGPALSDPGPKTEPLILHLRQATAECHAAVERLPVMVALMAPTVTWDDYRRYLERMAQVYGTLEPPLLARLDQALAARPGLRPAVQPKLPALLRDLAALGRPAPSIAAGPGTGDLSQTCGGLYVLEGATLGSRVIARHLRSHLRTVGTGDPLGSAAFKGLYDRPQDPSISVAWRQFGNGLDALLERGLIERDRVAEGARAFFERVYQILAGRS